MDCETNILKGIPIEKAVELKDAYDLKRQCLKWGDKFVRIVPKNKRDFRIPRNAPVEEDGVYVFLYDGTGKFWTTRVYNMFEYGSIHYTLVYTSDAKVILTAGEIRKTGKRLEFNLLSGSYMKEWMEEELGGKCDDLLITRTKAMLETTHPDLDVVYSTETFVSPRIIPLTKEHLDEFHSAGFEIRLYSDKAVCLYEPVLLRAYIATTPYPDEKKKYEDQLHRAENDFTLYTPTGGNRRKTRRYKMPRKMSRAYCKKTPCRKMGFTQKASCRPWKNCFTVRAKPRSFR